MQSQQPLIGGNLEFLQPHKVDSERFSLSSGEQISIQKYFLTFNSWRGAPIPNTYNGKTVLDWNGEPVFAELAVLRLFQSHGWNGVWVDSYRRKFRVGLPDVVEPIELPQKQRELIDSIRAKTGRSGGCWDVLVWRENVTLFLELKRSKKDRIQSSQNGWLTAAIDLGLTASDFALVEWDMPDVATE
ncbi:MAG: hypothetical protein UY63_C0006G0040 [Parcubacteria group bacterium GW2011_GWA2_51_10]|nr:MAG: hypothetical protein UY63_C0006G0040 [Parcubacteria group bacterium GW2011_GWA2_51_10]